MNYTVPRHIFKFGCGGEEGTEMESEEEDLVDSEDDEEEDEGEEEEEGAAEEWTGGKRRRSCGDPGMESCSSLSLSSLSPRPPPTASPLA